MDKLPKFPEFKAIDLDCKKCVDRYFDKHPPTICELTFSNLFIWKNFDFSKFTTINNNLCILNEPLNEPAYFLPPVGDHYLKETIDQMLNFTPRISRAPETLVKTIAGPNSALKAELIRNHCDYVYLVKDLIELKGKKYDGKRNHIKKFKKNYAYEYRRLVPADFARCQQVFDEWIKARTSTDLAERAQNDALKLTFENFEALGLIGGGIFIKDQLQAFSIGIKLNAETADIHFEFTRPKFQGLSQVINQEFAAHEWSNCKFINREQDLGLPGLRNAKLSYHPHHLENKYNLIRT